MVKERIDTMPGFPKKLESELIHCILAHHGELEYGSPKKPALIEAMALNLADNADAKMETKTDNTKCPCVKDICALCTDKKPQRSKNNG